MKRQAASLPPYAKSIVAARQRREPVNLFLYAGERAWDFAQYKAQAVVVPDDWSLRDWRWISGLAATLVVRGWGGDEVRSLAHFLVRSGASPVVALRVVRDGPVPSVETTHYVARKVAA